MEELRIQDAIERIQEMEHCFDELQKAADENMAAIFKDDSLKELLQRLTEYYEGGQWLQDYELDEEGVIPEDLKRGVLAQDAVYDFLDRIMCVRDSD